MNERAEKIPSTKELFQESGSEEFEALVLKMCSQLKTKLHLLVEQDVPEFPEYKIQPSDNPPKPEAESE